VFHGIKIKTKEGNVKGQEIADLTTLYSEKSLVLGDNGILFGA